MSLFALVTNSAEMDSLKRDALTGFLEGKGWHVWHWFEDTWLIDTGAEDVSPNFLHVEVLNVPEMASKRTGFLLLPLTPETKLTGFLNKNGMPWLLKRFTKVTTET